MLKIKILAAAIMVSFLLFAGNPDMTAAGAADSLEMPPAVVLVQDSDNGMLLKHSFEQDNGIWIPGDENVDPGFYVDVQSSR